MTREEILNEIRRTAAENGGKPLGRARFTAASGITEYDINFYWARFGDAQREAGLQPNMMNAAHSTDLMMGSFIGLTRKLGRVPTRGDMRVERTGDRSFPDSMTYQRFGRKNDLVGKVLDYCRKRPEHADVIAILAAAYVPSSSVEEALPEAPDETDRSGFVYLVKGHPGEYKIGRTNLVDRRLSELGATSSVEQQRIHEIKTDDPPGVEAYWHARFADKRMRGEWFRLNASDVRAFKRWRRIY